MEELLFITPVHPTAHGRGKNFRALQWVGKLCRDYRVTVLCTSVYGNYPFRDEPTMEMLGCRIVEWKHKPALHRQLWNVLSFKPHIWNTGNRRLKEFLQQEGIEKADVILFFRIEQAPIALSVATELQAGEIWADLDEVDSIRTNRVARLKRENRVFVGSIKSYLISLLFRSQESRHLSSFDRVFLSTKRELELLDKLYNFRNAEVVENRLPYKPAPAVHVGHSDPYRFLFIGDSKYYPNKDAIQFILNKLIPRIRNITSNPFKCLIVGGENREAQSASDISDYAEMVSSKEPLQFVYERTDAVIIPLRAGSGSSLKYLEALQYGKPVVSTPIGVRGFDIKHGEHALIGDTHRQLAEYCDELMNSVELQNHLSATGYRWFTKHHAYHLPMDEPAQ